MLRFGLRIVLAASALLLFVAVWILIPAPNGLLLPLAVGSPEVSPILLAAGVLLSAVAARYAKRNGVARLALVLAATASLVCLVPIVQMSVALGRFDREMAMTTARPSEPIPGEVRVT
ncbi:MAG: hypothetical protein EHM55_22465, partial [Acidobacteria bacterium]